MGASTPTVAIKHDKKISGTRRVRFIRTSRHSGSSSAYRQSATHRKHNPRSLDIPCRCIDFLSISEAARRTVAVLMCATNHGHNKNRNLTRISSQCTRSQFFCAPGSMQLGFWEMVLLSRPTVFQLPPTTTIPVGSPILTSDAGSYSNPHRGRSGTKQTRTKRKRKQKGSAVPSRTQTKHSAALPVEHFFCLARKIVLLCFYLCCDLASRISQQTVEGTRHSFHREETDLFSKTKYRCTTAKHAKGNKFVTIWRAEMSLRCLICLVLQLFALPLVAISRSLFIFFMVEKQCLCYEKFEIIIRACTGAAFQNAVRYGIRRRPVGSSRIPMHGAKNIRHGEFVGSRTKRIRQLRMEKYVRYG